jgi:hypothetical protein
MLFPGPQATSSLKEVLHDPKVDLFLQEEIFPCPQAASRLKDVLHNLRVDLFLPEEIFSSRRRSFPAPRQPPATRNCSATEGELLREAEVHPEVVEQ